MSLMMYASAKPLRQLAKQCRFFLVNHVGVRAILRQIFPRIVSMSSDAKVSGNCSAGILKWIISLRHLKGWAIKSK